MNRKIWRLWNGANWREPSLSFRYRVNPHVQPTVGEPFLRLQASVLILFLSTLLAVKVPGGTNEASSGHEWQGRYWQIEHGLPHDVINSIVQTRDGFLWIGTSAGRARFDAVRFRIRFHAAPGEGTRIEVIVPIAAENTSS